MRLTLTLIALFLYKVLIAQDLKEEKLSINYTNISKIDFMTKIESKSNYTFFYLKKWIDTVAVSGSYSNVKISKILDDVFKTTTLNYHITNDKKIILTNNVFIHTNLPIKFSTTNISHTNTTPTKIKKPILFVAPQFALDQKIIKIGKETKDSGNKKFTVSGYVYNKNTHKPIAGLVITVKNNNIITDSLGFYKLKLAHGFYEFKTRAIGIKNYTQKVIVYNNGKLNFNLQDSSEILDEVVIKADVDKNVKQVVTGVTEFNVEEIKTIPLVLGERDVLKVAASLPGIKTAGEGSSGYSVRGGKTDQNLILLDDGVVYNPTHFFGIFSAVNPFTTGKIKIFKGSAPSEYGGRLSSVFDIKTKAGSLSELKGEASIGPVTSNITLETPIKKETSSLIFGARGTYSNWILKSLDDTSLENSSASFYDVISKYKHKINDNNTIEITGYFSYDDYKITSDSLHSYSNRLLSAKWNKIINNKHNASLLFANSQYKFDIEYLGGADSDFKLGYKLNETHLKLKLQYKYNKMHKFDYGLSSKLYIINPGSKNPKGSASIVKPIEVEQEKALESALFFTDNITLNDQFSFDFGLRYSIYASLGKGTKNIYESDKPKNLSTIKEVKTYRNNEIIKTYNGLEIRTSTRYKFNPTFSIKASYNNTFQYIQSLSNNTTASPTDTWRLSGINIKPQESRQITVGLYKNFKDDLYEFSIENYFKQATNILDYKVGADLLINKNVETEVLQGKSKSYGVEFLIKKKAGKLNGWLGYTYSRSFSKFDGIYSEERINNGDFFPSNIDKPHDVSLVANYKMTKRFSWSFNFAYQTGRPVTYPVGKYTYNGNQYVYYSEHNKYRIPDYFRLDIGLNIEGNHKIKKFAHSFWNISIYNVLGRNNPYSVFFVTKDGKINAYKSSIFSIPVPTITYNFKF